MLAFVWILEGSRAYHVEEGNGGEVTMLHHVYDLTNKRLWMRDGIGLGGIFHGAFQVCSSPFRILIFISI